MHLVCSTKMKTIFSNQRKSRIFPQDPYTFWYNTVVCNILSQHFHATLYTMLYAKIRIKMADKDVIVGACGVIIATLMKRRRRNRTRRWIRNRQQFGVYQQELQLSDVSSYRNFLRMDVSTFASTYWASHYIPRYQYAAGYISCREAGFDTTISGFR